MTDVQVIADLQVEIIQAPQDDTIVVQSEDEIEVIQVLDQGIPGPPGEQGEPGRVGDTGLQGPLGPAGPVGPVGPQGNTGPAGPSPWQQPPVAWAPSTSYTATIPASTVMQAGSTYVCITSHTSTSTFDPTKWSMLGGSGPQGATGPAGPAGPTGAQGVPGPQGTPGPQGDPGPTGGAGPAGPTGPQGNVGAAGPTPWASPPVPWAPVTPYVLGPPASLVTNAGATYVATTSHTSGATFAADLAAGRWVAIVGSMTSCYVSDTAPASPQANALWWNSTDGQLYLWYNDGNSSQWVIATPTPDASQFLMKSGGTMTGPLTLAADPVGTADAATKSYVDSSTAASLRAATNLRLQASVAANVLTVAVKTTAGNDPSPSDPVVFFFETNGIIVRVPLTSALSLATVVGSTFGLGNGNIIRLWIVVFNDAGTLRLGLFQAVANTAGVGVVGINPLQPWGIASAVAMSSVPTSAGVFVCNAAVANKAYQTIGYMEFPAWATGGSFASAPSKTVLWGPGTYMPGQTIKHAFIINGAGGSTSSTTLVTVPNSSLQIGLTSLYNPLKLSYTCLLQYTIVASNNLTHSVYIADNANTNYSAQYFNSVASSSGGLQMSSPVAIQLITWTQNLTAPLFKLMQQINSASSTATCSGINAHFEELVG